MPLNELESRLVAASRARAARMEQDLEAIVAIESGWGEASGIARMQAFFQSRLEQLGASITRHSCDEVPGWLAPGGKIARPPEVLVATHGARNGVLLSGHLDTVHTVGGGFTGFNRKSDGTVVGPGVVDMKGGLIIMLHALESLSECGIDSPWTVALVADEESGSFGSRRALQAVAAGHAAALVYEPPTAEGCLVQQRPGSGTFRIEVFGRSAHSGRDPEKGVSAVKALMEASLPLLNASRPREGLAINIGPLEGGSATNIVPDHAVAMGNWRFRDAARQAEAEALFLAAERGSKDDLPHVQVQRACARPPLVPDASGARLREVAQATMTDLGLNSTLGSTGGVSDSNTIAGAGVPVLDGFGARGGNMHRTDEFAVLASLSERAALSAIMLWRLSGK